MSDANGGTWPEQEAVGAWLEKHAISVPFPVRMELQSAVTEYRIQATDDLRARLAKAEAALAKAQGDAQKFEWMLDEPEASQHLLNLLRQRKGDKTSFRNMIDRLRASKAAIAQGGGDVK